MKKSTKLFFTTIILGILISFSSFAAESRKEYREETAPIRAELQSLEEEMKPLREENKTIAGKYRSIQKTRKETGILSVDQDAWNKARELHQQIKELRETRNDSDVKALRQAAKAAAKEKDFDTAIQKLQDALNEKKARLESLKQLHTLWNEIDLLLEVD